MENPQAWHPDILLEKFPLLLFFSVKYDFLISRFAASGCWGARLYFWTGVVDTKASIISQVPPMRDPQLANTVPSFREAWKKLKPLEKMADSKNVSGCDWLLWTYVTNNKTAACCYCFWFVVSLFQQHIWPIRAWYVLWVGECMYITQWYMNVKSYVLKT